MSGVYDSTKTGYICVDLTAVFIFRLRQGGGPYIPGCRPHGQNHCCAVVYVESHKNGAPIQAEAQIPIGAVWGVAIGGITLAVGPLSMISEHWPLAALQVGLMILIMPGLIGAGQWQAMCTPFH